MYTQRRGKKVRFFESYLDPLTGNRRTVSVTLDRDTSHTRKIAAELLLDKIREKTGQSDSDMTLRQACDGYLAHKRCRPSTIRTQRSECNTLCRLIGGDVRVIKITDALAHTRLSCDNPRRENHRLERLRAVLYWCKVQGLPVHDVQYVYVPPRDDIDARKTYLEPSEINSLLTAIKPIYRDLTRFLLLSGLRIGEALALQVSDVDCTGKTIDVTKSLTPRGEVNRAKTRASRRKVYMQPELYGLVESIITHNVTARAIFDDPPGPLFVDSVGHPLSQRKYRTALTAAMPGVTPHMLRHTHASMLYAQGIERDVVARRLGHAPGSEDRTTMAIYVHITQDREAIDRAAMDNVKILPSGYHTQ